MRLSNTKNIEEFQFTVFFILVIFLNTFETNSNNCIFIKSKISVRCLELSVLKKTFRFYLKILIFTVSIIIKKSG
jgi:hypothetical protein